MVKQSRKKSAFEKGNKIKDEKGIKIKIRRAREKEGKRERKNGEQSKKNLHKMIIKRESLFPLFNLQAKNHEISFNCPTLNNNFKEGNILGSLYGHHTTIREKRTL